MKRTARKLPVPRETLRVLADVKLVHGGVVGNGTELQACTLQAALAATIECVG